MDYQDMLAEVGASSAHPGGMQATRLWQEAVEWKPGMNVLDVGCGTGRTLTELCRQKKCRGFGVDVRDKMIDKATRRAQMEQVQDVEFAVAGAASLPFPSGMFDVVYSESVNVFLDEPLSGIQEYYRVLRHGGYYVDVEMLVTMPVDDAWRQSVEKVYGARYVPDVKRWKKLYSAAGFSRVQVLRTQNVNPYHMMDSNAAGISDIDLSSDGAYENPEVLQSLQLNSQWMQQNHGPLGYGVFLCIK